jgi:hypothetical protein
MIQSRETCRELLKRLLVRKGFYQSQICGKFFTHILRPILHQKGVSAFFVQKWFC